MIKFGFWIMLVGFWVWLFSILSIVHPYTWYDKLIALLILSHDEFLAHPAAYFVLTGCIFVTIGLLNKRDVTRGM